MARTQCSLTVSLNPRIAEKNVFWLLTAYFVGQQDLCLLQACSTWDHSIAQRLQKLVKLAEMCLHNDPHQKPV